jgi:glutathione peroxidase
MQGSAQPPAEKVIPHLTAGQTGYSLGAMKLSMLFAMALMLGTACARAGDSIYDIQLKDIDGKATSLNAYRGKVLLLVNVASKCGNTPQYAGLEALYRKHKDQGLVVVGFPCNQFGGQEPGTNEEIKQFCSSRYEVSFPMMDKLEVNGPGRHSLYTLLAGKDSPVAGDIRWNFTKFLVSREGKIVKRFDSKIKPEAPELVTAVEAELAAKK